MRRGRGHGGLAAKPALVLIALLALGSSGVATLHVLDSGRSERIPSALPATATDASPSAPQPSPAESTTTAISSGTPSDLPQLTTTPANASEPAQSMPAGTASAVPVPSSSSPQVSPTSSPTPDPSPSSTDPAGHDNKPTGACGVNRPAKPLSVLSIFRGSAKRCPARNHPPGTDRKPPSRHRTKSPNHPR